MSDSRTLQATVGVSVAAILLAAVPVFEGTIYRGYKDPVGIITACVGHTGDSAALGQTYTPEQCSKMLNDDLVRHADGVLSCTPGLKGRTGPLAASVSFAFNVGTVRYCNSTMAAKFKAGDISGGCAELSKWVYAGDRKLPGLVERRKAERAICEGKY